MSYIEQGLTWHELSDKLSEGHRDDRYEECAACDTKPCRWANEGYPSSPITEPEPT